MLRTTLPNGLRVLVQENHASAVVAAQVWVEVGSADETADEAGLAHVHEHMLFKGTARRPVGAIAADVEAAGGDINAWTSLDQTVYHVTIASRELPVALDILADAVQHSAFDPDELSRELEVVLEEVRRGRDQPSRVASHMLMASVFAEHPYERPVIGFEQTIRQFTRPMILDFYRRWYQPQNMCLVVVGDVDSAEVVDLASRLFDESLNAGELPARSRPSAQPHDGIRGRFAAQDIQETHLAVAWPSPPLNHEDTPALDVLSVILGVGESSRLYARVKWRDQLVNDCYASAYTPRDPGATVVAGQVHGEGVQPALAGLLTETLRLRFEDVQAHELAKARTILEADSVYQRETVQGMARKLGLLETVAGDVEFEEKYFKKIRAVTADDVRDVAVRYLDPACFSVSVLTPLAQDGALDLERVQTTAKEVIQALEAEYAHAPTRRPTGVSHPAPPPAPAPSKSASLERAEVTPVTLKNGAKLLVLPDASVPLVSIRSASMGGLIAETGVDNGVTCVLGELLVRGTERNTYSQIIEEIDAMAGSLSGVAGRNSIGLRGYFLKEHWSRGFEIFSDSLLNAALPSDEFEKVLQTQLEDIDARQDNSSTVAFEGMLEKLFANHPYGQPIVGSRDSVRNLTVDMVRQHFRTQLRPDRQVICVVGDVDVDETIEMMQARIGTMQPHPEAGEVRRPSSLEALSGRQAVFSARDKEQAHIVLGFRGYSMSDDRHYALEILSSVLGGQSGRLFIELRDKASLAYSVGAYCLGGVDSGYFTAYIGTAPEKVAQAEAGIRTELDRVLQAPITADELSRAQRYLIGSHEISLQRASARSSTMALNELYGLGYKMHEQFSQKIEAVTIEDVRAVAQDIIRFDACVRSVVGPQSLQDAESA